MNKKNFLGIGIILIIIGLIASIAGFAMLDFNYKKLSADYGKYTTKQDYFNISDIKNRDFLVEVPSGNVKIKKSQSDNISIKYSPEIHHVDLSDGKITIKEAPNKINKKWYEYILVININFEDYSDIEIEVPSDFIENMEINSKYGSTSIEDIGTVKSLKIESNSGNLNISNISVDENADISSKYGNMDIKDINTIKNLKIETSSGNLKINSVSIDENADIFSKYGNISIADVLIKKTLSTEAGSGNLYAENLQAGNSILDMKYGRCKLDKIDGNSLKINAGSSDIQIKNGYIAETIDLYTKYGNINTESINAADIKLETGSGSITGYIDEYKNKFSIIANSKSGSTNLESEYGTQESSKKLNVRSTYGNIKITFKK